MRGPAARPGAEGFTIPDAFRDRLGRFESDDDGKLSGAEIEAMPGPARERVKEAIRRRLGNEGPPERP